MGALEKARKAIRLPLWHLWLRYSALGGVATIAEVECRPARCPCSERR